MFTSLRQSRKWLAEVDARVLTFVSDFLPAHVAQSHSMHRVAMIPAFTNAAWTFGYTKPHQRPPEPSH